MKLYREDQKWHDRMVILLGSVMIAMLATALATRSAGFWNVMIGMLIISGLVLLVLTLRLKIRISPGKMTIRISPIPWTRIKFSKDEVIGIEFLSAKETKSADAWSVHFGRDLRIFKFGDSEGMIIHKADGQDVVVLSKQLFKRREDVINQLKTNGWNLSSSN